MNILHGESYSLFDKIFGLFTWLNSLEQFKLAVHTYKNSH